LWRVEEEEVDKEEEEEEAGVLHFQGDRV